MNPTPAPSAPAGLLQDVFLVRGERLVVGNHTPIVLAGSQAWFVESGEVDVFAVELADAKPAGPRTHLFRADSGQLLFGLDAEGGAHGPRLLAVGTNGARVIRVSHEVLRELLRQPACAPELTALVDRWVELLCDGIAREVVPKRCTELDPGGEQDLAAGAHARTRTPVAWLRHVAGSSQLLGEEHLRVNGQGVVPLARRAWLRAAEASRVRVVDTDTAVRDDAVWSGLGHLHRLVLACAEQMARRAEAAGLERASRKVDAEQAAMGAACTRLASTMEPRAGRRRAAAQAAAEDTRASLLAACRVVGETQGLTFKAAPPASTAGTARNELDAILRASRVRARRVMLRDDWWRHELGALLAWVAASKAPVALVPIPGPLYELHDPSDSSVRAVTPEVAESLAPFAYVFYRPFPGIALGLRDLLRFGLRSSGHDVLLMVLCGIAGALIGMVPSYATGLLFNSVIPGAQRPQLLQLVVILVVCAFAGALFNAARGVAVLRIESRMAGAVQSAVWDRLLALPLPFFRRFTAGDLAVRAMSIDAMRQIISGSTVTAIMGGVFSLGNIVLMMYYSTALAWRALLLIAVAVVVTTIGGLLQLRPQRASLTLQAKTSGIVLQLLTSIAKLRLAGAEARAFVHWSSRFGAQRELQFQVRRASNWVAAFSAGFPTVASLVIFACALPMLSAGQHLRPGDFLAFLSAFMACLGALLGTSQALLAAVGTLPLYEQAKPILESLPEVDVGKTDPGVLSGDIEIEHAVFRYTQDGPLVLRDLTLRVRPGEFLAIVGPSGSGKSTLLRLLLGFEKLESGAIYFDEQELSGLDVQAVRRQIGVVLQNGRLMSGDIYTNIVGSAPVSVEEAWEAARMAGLDTDIRRMPMGMHTVISEGGGTLSGGQRQRLLIARALVHRPRILLFDEATSALDNRTQAVVTESLGRLQATRIVIAHRLSTIRPADRICVFDHGRIVQSGTYDELIDREGLFAELARRQLT